MSFKDKVCFVSGASGTIGIAICQLFLERGTRVIALYNKNEEKLKKLKSKLTHQQAKRLDMVQVDLMDSNAIMQTCSVIINKYQYIDVLVVCAGVTLRKPAMMTNEQESLNLLQLNLISAIQLSRIILRTMFCRSGGRIIYIGSRAGSEGLAGQAVYAATKGALTSYAKSLAQEVGMKGITVNLVAPGAVNDCTNMNYSEEENNKVKERIGLRRLAEPEEVAATVGFLASEEASYLTGTVVAVDGGGRF
ncbi:SDR family oxidoreductase [Vibrio crassostreae]|nr:SDR family oxidoreductase [Vibrio crassostreae]CAK2774566.1 SDR family oxidoreductase [Vibrio crassostreae]CAK3217250.1 SDR family oxidoreductase [Vibrio crassostreae]CAK3841949.1 SDR family oxidoreductase [Vibrio crassostreae]